MKKTLHLLLASACIIFIAPKLDAAIGDTLHVTTHNQVTVVTNPSAGANKYPVWAVFPDASVKYRKVILNFSYKCPPGQACGEWDYLDYVFIRRKGGVDSLSKNMEIARFITPYGNSFNSTWHAEFHLDITDYQFLLHDSVEIEYNHTGYETNVGKGWLLTLDFEFIEGTPVMETVAITNMWTGSFPYGNITNSIENYLTPTWLTMDNATNMLRMRIVQSGHGSDNTNCAEFCSKARTFLVDGIIFDIKNIWRTCGANPLYPQAGTWVYNRGGWCPGAIVDPDIYNINVSGGATHSLDVDMPSYGSSSPSANYVFGTQAIEFKSPLHANDASIEEVYSPNNIFEYSRDNAICDNAKIQLRNNGTSPLTNCVIKYGIVGQLFSSFQWSGNLLSHASETVTLPDYVLPVAGMQKFKVYLESVNGVADAYPHDDTVYTQTLIPQVFDTVIVFVYKTNNIPSQSAYVMYDHSNVVVKQVIGSSLAANSTYRDTLHLAPGCYRFTFSDSGNDGLTWWANAAQGSGYIRFENLAGSITKSFNSDFGSEVSYNLLVDPANIVSIDDNDESQNKVQLYPNPNAGTLICDIHVGKKQDLKISVYNILGRQMHTQVIPSYNNDGVVLNMKNFADGVYLVKVTSVDLNVTRKVVLKK